MKQTYQIKDILAGNFKAGQQVTVKGWVRTRRDSKAGFSFLTVYDGSCFDGIQVIADNTLANYQSDVLKANTGCSVIIQGEIKDSEGQEQALEVLAKNVDVLGWVEDPEHYPVAKKRHSFEFLRTVAHLRPRTNVFGAIARIRHQAAFQIHQYFNQNNFYWVSTPIITASDCEGAGELFKVSTLDFMNIPKQNSQPDYSHDFFGEPTYLTVSGQLNLEAYCTALSRVYTFGPTFRAENSHTSRHLAEFWMVEAEIAFADLTDDIDLAEDFLKQIIAGMLNACEKDFAIFNQHVEKGLIDRLQKITETEFVRMDYSEAITILSNAKQKFEFPVEWGLDLQSEHERYLCEKHVNAPVVVMNYPEKIKAFYMRRNDDGKTCAAMDLLVPGVGELIGGSQREDRLEMLDAKIPDEHVRNELWWYRDLRRYGTVPHAGFGLGFERLMNYITGMENVRDVIPFPRTPKHALF